MLGPQVEPEYSEATDEVIDFNTLCWGYHQRCHTFEWVTIRTEQGLLVASAAISRIFDGKTALFCSDAVLPVYRGQGLHRKLISKRLDMAIEQGCERAVCQIRPGNTPCRLNYRAFGFVEGQWQIEGVQSGMTEFVRSLV